MSVHERVVARVGTTQGRVIEVVREPYFVAVRDPAVPHHGGMLAHMNTDQAGELAEALARAVNS
jgi:hypothetical protein